MKPVRDAPLHPGALLRQRVSPALGLSVSQAVRELRITRQTLHRVLAGSVLVTPEMAIGLGRLSGTSPHIRFGLQQARDLWRIERALAGELKLIPTHALPPAIRNDIEQPHGP